MRKSPKQLLLRTSFCWLLLVLTGATLSQDQVPAWNLEVSVESGRGDAEEFLDASLDDPQRWPAGYTYTASSDLELGNDPQHGRQLVGLRFDGLDIPTGARIEEALLEFSADGAQSADLSVVISAEASADPLPFEQDPDGAGGNGLSSRETGTARVSWSPEPWTAGETYTSPDISPLLQEVVDRADWEGGALVLLISPTGSGSGGFRPAVSSDDSPASAPRLLVRFTPPDAAEGAESAPRAPTTERPQGRALIPGASTRDGGDGRESPADARSRPEAPEEPSEAAETEVAREPAVHSGDPRRSRFEFRSDHARGVKGSVLLSDYGLGGTAVTLFLEGVETGAEYRVSIHSGDCGTSSAALFGLEPVTGSRPFSTSVIPRGFDELVSGDLHLNVYRITEEFTRVAGCARLGD